MLILTTFCACFPQTYIRNYVDTLAPRIREANRVGQNLIQSAAPRVSTTQLEHDLEAMNDRWNKLKTTVSSNGRLTKIITIIITAWSVFIRKSFSSIEMNVLYKQIFEKLSVALQNSDREAKLNEGLLRCGKFQEALNSLMSWIGETEELVSHQKDASSDYKVVKAQLSEQLVRQGAWD